MPVNLRGPLIVDRVTSFRYSHATQVHTDAGIIGLGEATLEGRSQTVETAVREIARYLVGKNPLTIEEHWQTINRGTFYRNGPVLARCDKDLNRVVTLVISMLSSTVSSAW